MPTRWLLLLAVASLLPRASWAQAQPPIQQWQVSFDYPQALVCGPANVSASSDWSLAVNSTRDGGYISAGYAGGYNNSSQSDCAPLRPAITKFRADGSVEWKQFRNSIYNGRFNEAIELVDGSGYLAVGYDGVHMLLSKYSPTGVLIDEKTDNIGFTTFLGFNALGFSIREVLATGPLGLISDGFIIGGTRAMPLTAGSTTYPLNNVSRPNEMYLLRLDANRNKLWDENMGRTNTSTIYGAIARPFYSTGTLHAPTSVRPAHAPKPGGTLQGFAITGMYIVSTSAARDLDSIATEAAATTTANLALGVLMGDNPPQPAPGDPITSRVPYTYGRTGYASGTFPYCTPNIAIVQHAGTDLEQNETGDRIAVAGILNRMTRNECAIPAANLNSCLLITSLFLAGETHLLEWAINPADYTVASAPTYAEFVGVGGAGEFRPQVEPTADGGYLLAASKLASAPDSATNGRWGLNCYYLTRYSEGNTTTAPVRTWGKMFGPPAVGAGYKNVLACTLVQGLLNC